MPSAMRTVALALSLVSLAVHQPHVAGQPLDCDGFDSQIWAQSVYETDPAGYAALDPDGNGRACEELPSGAAPALWASQVPSGSQPVTLIEVTDGDTIRVDIDGRNEPVRLILIDAPETHDPNRPPECFGQEATTYLSWLLLLGGDLYLETDVSDRDRFGRLLRYVWLDFGDGEVYLVDEVLVRAGYAAFSTFPPDVKYVEEIREAGQFAREYGYGLWSGCITDDEGDTNELSGNQGIDAGQETEGSRVQTAPMRAHSSNCFLSPWSSTAKPTIWTPPGATSIATTVCGYSLPHRQHAPASPVPLARRYRSIDDEQRRHSVCGSSRRESAAGAGEDCKGCEGCEGYEWQARRVPRERSQVVRHVFTPFSR